MLTRLSSIIKIETQKSNKMFFNYFFGINIFFILMDLLLYSLGQEIMMLHLQFNLLMLIILIPLRIAVGKLDNPTFFKYIIALVYTFYIVSLVIINNQIDTFSLMLLILLIVFPLIYMSKKVYLAMSVIIVLFTVVSTYSWNLYKVGINVNFVAFYRPMIALGLCAGGYIGLCRMLNVMKYLLEDNVNPFIDQLTGAYNKHYLQEKLSNIPFRGNMDLSIIAIDVDNMKSINSNYGVPSGDFILQDFINTIKALTRESDSICRMEGDKFAIIVQHPKEFNASTLAKRIKSKIEHSTINVVTKGNKSEEINISASFGVATLNEGENSDNLLQRAEKSLQKAKKDGKNRIEISS